MHCFFLYLYKFKSCIRHTLMLENYIIYCNKVKEKQFLSGNNLIAEIMCYLVTMAFCH